jgi:NADPH:quinone reductase-like Zn-dependent oxidoreductase
VEGTEFVVDRKDLRVSEVRAAPVPQIADGEVLLHIDRFAFTANNVTYAVFGDAMAYWQFFPAPAPWGRVPVWGFADVVESKCAPIAKGERVYGYWPMSSHAVLQPAKVADATFLDGAPHRRQLPGAYQQYRRVARDRGYDAKREDQQAILQPLFITSFLIEDFLADNGRFGAQAVVIASASSKTALGTAFQLKRAGGSEVIGLTSPRNVEFCKRVGYYDRVVAYADLAALPAQRPTVFVDMAGDGKLLHDVHHHFGDQLKHSCIVGATHWENRGTQHALPGAKPQFFFAPARIAKRNQDWGPDGVMQRFGQAWGPFVQSVDGWMKVTRSRGAETAQRVYREVLEGKSGPEQGHMLSL